MIELFVPGKLQQVTNGSLSRAHWSARSKWSKGWKEKTWPVVIAAWQKKLYEDYWMLPDQPKRITFLAQVGATWDDDNLPAAIKPIRDALIGYVIHSDAPDSGHVFEYAQRIDRAHRGVTITIAPVTP